MKPVVPPIEVPRLSDLSRHRIREAVLARLDDGALEMEDAAEERADVTPLPVRRGRRRRTALVAAGAAIAAAAAAAVVVVAARGDAPGGPSFSRVATDDAPSRVTIGEADLTLAARSAMTVSEAHDGGVVVSLERGEVRCAVAPRGERPPFVVLAADVRVEVVGTHFAVQREGDAVGVTVEEGIVRVTRAGVATLVKKGETWPAAAAETETETETEAAAETEAEAEAGTETDDGAEMAMDPVRLRRPKQTKRESEPVEKPAAPAVDSVAQQFSQATKIEGERPAEALSIYKKLAGGVGTYAQMALYAQGRLESDLGHKDLARRLLKEYLRRYPNGLNAPVARELLTKLR